MNKLYKLYFYNKINNNLLNTCDKYQQRLKNIYSKEFLDKLAAIKENKSVFNYNNELTSTRKPELTKLKFKKICDNNINNNTKIISDKNAPMRKILPNIYQVIIMRFPKD